MTYRPRNLNVALATSLILLGAAAARNAAENTDSWQQGRTIDLSAIEARASERFAAIDANDDGQVTLDEFKAAKPGHGPMGAMGKGKRRMQRHMGGHKGAGGKGEQNGDLFAALDADGSGEISEAEFANRKAVHKAMRAERRFNKLDTDNNQVLTADELNARLQQLRALDTNSDGQVDREERKAPRAGRGARTSS
jgi:Ca2+-binding EF-hand superfamily protein